MDIAAATAIRASLWARGFRPVPVLNADHPDRKIAGKAPLGKGWTDEARRDPPFCATHEAVAHALNSGVLCDGLRVVDVDVDDPEIAAQVAQLAVETLGEAPVRWRRNSARVLFPYRAAEDEPRKRSVSGSGGKVEVLGKGNQFVAYGVHPSGAEIEWRPETLADYDRAALPAVTEDQVTAFLAAAAPLIGAPPETRVNGHDHAANAEAEADPLDIAAALSVLGNAGAPDWEWWNKIGMATWAASGGSLAGLAAWSAWSSKNPCHDQAACDERWRHYPTSPPSQIGAGTLFHLAREARAGWRKPTLAAGWPPEPGEDAYGAPALDGKPTMQNAKQEPARANPFGVWDAGDDDYHIPPRGWLLGNSFCRRFLSSVVAAGGTGKTALRLAQMISLALGRSLTGEHVFCRCRVLILSLEDDRDELRRRVYAVLRRYHIAPADVAGWLFLGAPKGLRLAEMRNGAPIHGDAAADMRCEMERLKPDIVSLDPFIKTHGLGENDNNALDFVCTLLATLAIDCDCAIDLPDHERKGAGTPGDADRARGGSSKRDAGRLVYTLTPMSPEEAQQFGVADGERRSFVRYDSAKVNIAPPSRDARWFRIVGVPLGNATEDYPHGDEVQTVEVWQPPSLWGGLDPVVLNRILDAIERGIDGGSRYSAVGAAGSRAAWKVIVEHDPTRTEKQAREMIQAWLRSGLLFVEDYQDQHDRKTRRGLRVDAAKRPS